MNPIWLVLLVGVAFLVILRLKGRGKRRRTTPVYSRRIDGFQVVAQLAPEMAGGCLFDHGIQFGKGFRRKEGPALPHDDRCGCKAMPFSFTSNEVFNGVLRDAMPLPSSIRDLPPEEAKRLAESLLRIVSEPLPDDAGSYAASAGLELFPEKYQSGVDSFLRERYTYLLEEKGGSNQAPEPARDQLKN